MKKSVRYIIIIIDFILILILISPCGSNRLVTLINLQYSYYYFAQSLIYIGPDCLHYGTYILLGLSLSLVHLPGQYIPSCILNKIDWPGNVASCNCGFYISKAGRGQPPCLILSLIVNSPLISRERDPYI